MAGHTVYCDTCCYYDHTNQVCNNPHGPYNEDCNWGEEDDD